MIRLLSTISILLSYSWLGVVIAYDHELERYDLLPIALLWILGVVSVGLNFYNGLHQKAKTHMLVLLGLSGAVWLFPPLLFTILGIPSLLCFLIVAFVLLLPKWNKKSFNLEKE